MNNRKNKNNKLEQNDKNNSISDAYIRPFKGYKSDKLNKSDKSNKNNENNKLNNKLEQNNSISDAYIHPFKGYKLEQIEASLIFASLFDTIGFGNGAVEFNYNYNVEDRHKIMTINNHISTIYFFTGGYKNLDNSLLASDDTILLMATTKALINNGSDQTYINSEQNYINEYLEIFNKYYIKDNDKRYFGLQTIESLTYLNKFTKSNKKNESFI